MRAGRFRGADVLFGVEVSGDLYGLVGGAGVERAPVVRRDNRHGSDPELPTRTEDPQCDLAAVRYE